MTVFEIITIIFSGISLFLSICFSLVSIYNSAKINKLNMRNNYFDLFKDDLTIKIPQYCTNFISKESEKFNDEVGKEFEVYINKLREKIKFLEYIDKRNYKDIDESLVAIEEEIILLPTRTDNKKLHIDNFYNQISVIYNRMNKHFS